MANSEKDAAYFAEYDSVAPLEKPNDKPKESDAPPVEEDVSNYSPAEERAMSNGWVPKEDWVEQGKDAEEWVSAHEFNRAGELMGRIKDQSKEITRMRDSHQKEIDRLKHAFEQLGEHNKKIAQTEYKKALKEVRLELAQAQSDGELDKVVELEDQIDELKKFNDDMDKPYKFKDDGKDEDKQPSPKQEENVDQDPYTKSWLEAPENAWFHSDKTMQYAAMGYSQEHAVNNPNASTKENLEYVENKIKEEFAHKFKKPSGGVGNTPSGEGKAKATGRKTKHTKNDLNEGQLEVGKTYVEMGVYDNLQEYVDDLAKIGEL